MDISFLTVATAALIPVTVGIVAAIRMATAVSDRYAPIISIAVGIGASFIFPASSIGLTVLAGIVIGLSASGLYSGTRATVRG